MEDQEKFQITVVFGNFNGREESDKYLKHIKHLLSKTMSKWVISTETKGSWSR